MDHRKPAGGWEAIPPGEIFNFQLQSQKHFHRRLSFCLLSSSSSSSADNFCDHLTSKISVGFCLHQKFATKEMK
jgi:hypothetical protein